MTDDSVRQIAESLGPFTLKYKAQENYSGEHREWDETIRIPAGNALIVEIAEAAIAAWTARR